MLTRSEERIDILSDRIYTELSVRLWGKGVVKRRDASGDEIAATSRTVVRSGQLVLSRIDARNGALGMVPEELDGAVTSNDFPSYNLDQNLIVPAFLGWMTRTPWFVDLCQKASEGTTNRVRLQEQMFLSSSIPLPPLSEQRRIVARIEELAAKVAEAKGLQVNSVEGIGALVVSAHVAASSGRTVELSRILIMDEHQVVVDPGGSYPQVGVRSFGQGLFAKRPVSGTETTYRSFNRLYDGALVLSQVKGWEGAIAVCGKELAGWYVSPEYRTFRCRPDTSSPDYLRYLVATDWFQFFMPQASRGVGGRRERIRPELFLSVKMLMPELVDQLRLAACFARLGELRELQAETQAELDALLPSILDKAFGGEL